MARRISSRTVVNRKALDAINAGYVDAFEALGQRFVEVVKPPDATPYGEGLVTTPDFGIWVNGKKVAGTATKPRGAKVKTGVTLIAGEGFPGRFQEFGTVTNPAQPHVTPAMEEVIPGASAFLSEKVRARLRGVR